MRKPSCLIVLTRAALDALIVIALAGCTSVGIDHPEMREAMDFGPPLTVNLCVMLDEGVSRADADSLLAGWDEEAPKYNLYLRPVSYQELPREGFF